MFKVKVEELEDLQATLLYSYDLLLLLSNATVGFPNVFIDPSVDQTIPKSQWSQGQKPGGKTFTLLTMIHNHLDPWIQNMRLCGYMIMIIGYVDGYICIEH